VRILTRASDLARLQGHIVKRRIADGWPGADVSLVTRDSAGDVDRQTPLWQLGDKGAFTTDLSDALVRGEADLVVHSWKDLPIEPRRDTVVAATLQREDPRDVLLIRRDAVSRRAPWLRVLSSSPRRAFLLSELLPAVLPWRVETVECLSVRGNVPTRLRHLIDGHGDALVVAKAALDRLLDPESPFLDAAQTVRRVIDACHWMVLPLREHPAAAAQGALALEVAASNVALADQLQRLNHQCTWRAVTQEREILAGYGGGCHQAIGATVLALPFGDVTSLRGRSDAAGTLQQWTLSARGAPQPKAAAHAIWPRPDECDRVIRQPLDVRDPLDDRGLHVARSEALPASWTVNPDRIVWVAGASTWRKLAARGIWVHGSSEGLSLFDSSVVDRLAGRPMQWHRLTHAGADIADAVATYVAESPLPADLDQRTHFFWRSGSEFRKALEAFPEIRDRWHACGPGHTLEVVERLAGPTLVRPCLGYTEWLTEITA
jgi:hydroxymethylbilane synthase